MAGSILSFGRDSSVNVYSVVNDVVSLTVNSSCSVAELAMRRVLSDVSLTRIGNF